MKMMYRLFENVSSKWDTLPKEKPVLEISQGMGTHVFMTVTDTQLHFHSLAFRENLQNKQSITLQDLTLQELADTITSMGYDVTITEDGEALRGTGAFTLLPKRNGLLTETVTLSVFTSKLWKLLYPIARLLQETENDIDDAIKQMFVTSSTGRWLDYWASFFRVKRVDGEDDNTLARRIFMTIVNLKTNNMAVEELVRYMLKTDATVHDIAPALFEVLIEPEYMPYGDATKDIIESVKGAGVDFILHYAKTLDENYPGFLTDKLGGSYRQADELVLDQATASVTKRESRYGYTAYEHLQPFTLNVHFLNGDIEIHDLPEKRDDRLLDDFTVTVGRDYTEDPYIQPEDSYVFGIGLPYTEEPMKNPSEAGTFQAEGELFEESRAGDVTDDQTAFAIAFQVMDKYDFLRQPAKPYGYRSFELNFGRLNVDELYGEPFNGDIIKAITAEQSEAFPNPEASTDTTLGTFEDRYDEPEAVGLRSFILGVSALNSPATLATQEKRYQETGSMVMTDPYGYPVKTSSW